MVVLIIQPGNLHSPASGDLVPLLEPFGQKDVDIPAFALQRGRIITGQSDPFEQDQPTARSGTKGRKTGLLPALVSSNARRSVPPRTPTATSIPRSGSKSGDNRRTLSHATASTPCCVACPYTRLHSGSDNALSRAGSCIFTAAASNRSNTRSAGFSVIGNHGLLPATGIQ